jgi:hypothetical protein
MTPLNREALARVDFEAVRSSAESRRVAFNWPEFLPHVLPAGWKLITGGTAEDYGASFVHRGIAFSVIISCARELDERRWIHLSVASPYQLPSWEKLCEIRDLFLGTQRKALLILAPAAEHVNIHLHCLHLWHCLDGDGLPDFTGGTNSI